MGFANFVGNRDVVERLQRLIAAPPAGRTLVLAGPEGIGKTTLGWMTGLALNCEQPPAPGDFCGHCASCQQATPLEEIDARIEETLAFRDAEVKTRGKELAPLAVQLHPQVRLYPPDGDMLSIHQARRITHDSQLQPDAGRRWALIVPELEQARWLVQNSLLKTLEEPGEAVTLILLVRNAEELLPTVRSRALLLQLAPVAAGEMEGLVKARRSLDGTAGALLARLSGGCPGRALRLDLEQYRRQRREALELLRVGLRAPRAFSLFQVTESVRNDKEKFETLVEILYSLLQDILYLRADSNAVIGNPDCLPELNELVPNLDWAGLLTAVEELDRVRAAARRYVNRPLSLDAWTLGLVPG